VPAHLSARLCASLQINGDWNSFLLDTQAGTSEREEAHRRFLRACKAGPQKGSADLSETAGAKARKAEA